MQQVIDLTCLLPHGDHLHHQRGEQAAAAGSAQQALTPLDTGAHIPYPPRHIGVIHRIGHQGQRGVQRHPCLEHHGKTASKTGQQGALYDGADDRQLELPAVPGQLALGGGDPAAPAEHHSRQNGEQQPPVVDEKVGSREQNAGRQRQLHPEFGEHASKHRDHHDIEDHHGDTNGDHHEAGVTHRGLDPLAGLQLKLEIVGELQKGLFQLTCVLTYMDDGDKQAAEYLGVRLHRAGERATVAKIFPQRVQRPL